MSLSNQYKIVELNALLAFQEANIRQVPSRHIEQMAILEGERARTKSSIDRIESQR